MALERDVWLHARPHSFWGNSAIGMRRFSQASRDNSKNSGGQVMCGEGTKVADQYGSKSNEETLEVFVLMICGKIVETLGAFREEVKANVGRRSNNSEYAHDRPSG
ncbi:MAG TPA: hypothetical protein VLQ90_05210, partial [Pyrinomonadaceae bacterium]|nr:hypothetical protein [Pyrinomonadaceae bacterium]